MKSNRKLTDKKFYLVTVACLAIMFCVSVSFSTDINSSYSPDQIIGVWKQVSPELGGDGEQDKIKIITKGHFVWIHTINGDIVMSLGGEYSIDGDTYIESIRYGAPTNQRIAFGRRVIYKVSFEGNRKHIIGGYENTNRVFNEIWERVE